MHTIAWFLSLFEDWLTAFFGFPIGFVSHVSQQVYINYTRYEDHFHSVCLRENEIVTKKVLVILVNIYNDQSFISVCMSV